MKKKFYYIKPVQKYTVTYNSNGGSGTVIDTNSPYDFGDTVTVLNNSFTKQLAQFVSWNTAADGSGTSYSTGDTFTISSNIILYAQWEPYSIKYFGGYDAALNTGIEFKSLEAETTSGVSGHPTSVSKADFSKTNLSDAMNDGDPIYFLNSDKYDLSVIFKVPDSGRYKITIKEVAIIWVTETSTGWEFVLGGDNQSFEMNGMSAFGGEYIVNHTFEDLNKHYLVICEEV